MKSFDILKQEYLDILSELDESFFNEGHKNNKKDEGLPGLFWQVNLKIIGWQKIKL